MCYVLNFVNDHSTLIMIYFLKQKNDTLGVTVKYLTKIVPYGSVKKELEQITFQNLWVINFNHSL